MDISKEPVLKNLLGANHLKKPGVVQGHGKPFDSEIVKKGAAELDNLQRVMQAEGIVVRRPDDLNYAIPTKTPDWEIPVGNSATCPRDVLIVFGNEIVEANMSMRARFFEYRSYRTLVQEYWKKGAKWSVAPKPLLADSLFDSNFPDRDSPDREETLKKGNLGITEKEPVWDAADFVRMGKDIIGQHSLATNLSGIEWVRRHLGPQYRVHTMQFDNPYPRHIDDTLVPIRPGVVLSAENLPPLHNGLDLFKKSDWRIIKVPPSPTCGNLNLNFLSIDERTVVVEESETDMQKLLESLGCRVLLCPLKSCYRLGGSGHCCTLDVRRRGTLQSYFPHLDALEKKQ